MEKVIKTNMHVYTITENGGKVSMVSDNPNENFNFEGVETSIDSVMQRFEVAMKLRGEVICESITDGWVDGEWAWEDDGTKPKAPADPEMKAWLESLGCKFDEDDAPKYEVDEDDVYGVVEQLCTDMEEKMIECGDYMIGYKYAEPDFQGRPAEWFEDMIFVTKKSDLDEDGDYVWEDCEEFRIGDYFTYVVELLRGDFDVIAEIKDAIVEYMENNRDLTPALEEIVDEAVKEQMKDFDKWVAGEDVDSGFGDDYFVKNDAPKLETEDTLTYENVKFFAEQYDIHMGFDGKYVEPRGIAQGNWDECLTFGDIHLEYTKEYWDKFWKIYCNVMCDLWGEEYNIAVDNIHDQLIFTPMIDEKDVCLI